jgi:hypothetical protein
VLSYSELFFARHGTLLGVLKSFSSFKVLINLSARSFGTVSASKFQKAPAW